MKTRITWRWTFGLLLTVTTLTMGCARDSAGSDTTAAVTNTPVPEPVVAQEASGTNAVPAPMLPEVDISQAPAKPITTEPLVPARIQSNPAALAVVKLATRGVDEGVMLMFVTNSPSAFNVGADDIIYLKDIGVPDAVVKAMIYRDHDLKEQGSATGTAAAAPTYQWTHPLDTNAAPQGEPAPAQVAPQYEGTAAPQPAPAAPASVTYATFNESLSSYGTWIEVEGYGRVWQPTAVVANPAWRPYLDGGRWVYTDQGWYWLSDYSWGWAPFHYGRWFCHGSYGWCWAPDLVWGPSWVTWRYNNAYCGWAPLPPAACYYPGYGFSYYGCSVGIGFGWGLGYSSWCFVGYNNFCHAGLRAYRVPDHYARPVYNNTLPVNRIVAQNNLVVNRGVPPQNITAVTKQEVRRLPIHDRTPATDGRIERLNPASGSLDVHRPAAQVRADDPGIVQRSRREMPRSGASQQTASAPSAPLAERGGLTRPTPSSSATGTRGNATAGATTPVTRSQPTRETGLPPTHVVKPANPSVETSRPATVPGAQLSQSKPQAKQHLETATRQSEPARVGQPIILRGPDTSRTQPTDRSTAPANQSTSPTRPSTTWTPTTPAPRAETRAQTAQPPSAWTRNETPRPVAPAPAPSASQVPQKRWNPPAPVYASPAPAPRAPAPVYQAPSRSMDVPRAAPMPAPQPAYRPPAPAPAAPPMSAPSAPANRGQGNSGGGSSNGGNPRGNR